MVNSDLREDKNTSNLSCFALEFLGEVDNETVVEIFSTKMGITNCGLYFENTLFGTERCMEVDMLCIRLFKVRKEKYVETFEERAWD
jgi:hypothetical protein